MRAVFVFDIEIREDSLGQGLDRAMHKVSQCAQELREAGEDVKSCSVAIEEGRDRVMEAFPEAP